MNNVLPSNIILIDRMSTIGFFAFEKSDTRAVKYLPFFFALLPFAAGVNNSMDLG